MAKRTSLDSIRESLRLQQVYNVFYHYGMDMLFDRGLVGGFRRRMQAWIYKLPEPSEPLSIPVKTRLMVEELGPIYIKMGQIVSSQSPAFPAEWAAELVKLQSNVPPFPAHEVRDVITAELGAPPEALFASFNPEPMAAASTAQVHRATLPTGKEVVVKVQRPNIRQHVKADLGIMRNAVRVATRRSDWARELNLVGMLEEFGASVLREIDYGNEAYNAFRLSRNLAGLAGVRIPNVYLDYSTSRVLTMDFIPGVKITNLEAIDQAGIDRQMLAENTLRYMVKQLLVDGFFHADPHPGNLLVDLDTGVIGFIDVGMVGELELMQRINLINLFMVMYQQDTQGVAQALLSVSKPIRKVDENGYYRDFGRRVGRYLEFDTRASFSETVSVCFELLQEHGLRLDPQFTLALKAVMQAEAITRILFPRTEIVGSINKHILEQVSTQLTTENISRAVTKEGTYLLKEMVQRLPNLREAAFKWLEQYEQGQFNLKVDTSDLSKDLKELQGVARQVIIGVMLIGMIIGSAIAVSVATLSGDVQSLLPRLAFFGYVFSMVVAAIFVVSLLWRLWKSGYEEFE